MEDVKEAGVPIEVVRCSVDEEGFPNVKAMLKPRKMEGLHRFYLSTNTSSMRVKQYMNNPNACIYFYHKGLIKYTGVMLKGKMEILTDQLYHLCSGVWITAIKKFVGRI